MDLYIDSPHHGYFGHKVTSVVVTTLPLLLTDNLSNVSDRLLLATCGALGSCLAIIADRPSTWQETAGRIAAGFIACALFVPYLAKRYQFVDQVDSLIAAAGVAGILSWYVCGSAVRFLQWVKTSNVLSDMLRNLVQKQLPNPAPAQWPPDMTGTPAVSNPGSVGRAPLGGGANNVSITVTPVVPVPMDNPPLKDKP